MQPQPQSSTLLSSVCMQSPLCLLDLLFIGPPSPWLGGGTLTAVCPDERQQHLVQPCTAPSFPLVLQPGFCLYQLGLFLFAVL